MQEEQTHYHAPHANPHVEFTEEVFNGMTASEKGNGYIHDTKFPNLLAAKLIRGGQEKVQFFIWYGNKHRLVVDGKARTRETLGFWPEVSIERAREIAANRMAMWEEQKKQPVAAPPARRKKRRRNPKALVPIHEALLAPKADVSPEDQDRYEKLMMILMDAHDRAANGKGEDRHGNGQPFEEQPMQVIMNGVGEGFALGQAIKKLCESQSMAWERARNERLDAMVYIAGSILWRDQAE